MTARWKSSTGFPNARRCIVGCCKIQLFFNQNQHTYAFAAVNLKPKSSERNHILHVRYQRIIPSNLLFGTSVRCNYKLAFVPDSALMRYVLCNSSHEGPGRRRSTSLLESQLQRISQWTQWSGRAVRRRYA